MPRVTLKILSVGNRPLEKHIRVFLPDGTEIPNCAGITVVSRRAGEQPKTTIEIENCDLVEITELPESARKES